MTEIIRIFLVFACAPSARQSIAAARAGNRATAQWKILTHILACRHHRPSLEAVLNAPEAFLADNTLMFGLSHGDTPAGHGDIATVEDLREHSLDRHLANTAIG
ncbi:hypothetical protein TALK_13535 [Thalassospira alkalitolerans]|uniref:Uncharacterized protein n=1 Tax=Thalassospira alkalitolerans TaxID=1293890 RepID=A0A1Y2L960_9PROT|nr:hypothetical protein TALK_13535 [Thalassospira alkalitolerans]